MPALGAPERKQVWAAVGFDLISSSDTGAGAYYQAYLAETLRGDFKGSRDAYRRVLDSPTTEPEVAARAAHHFIVSKSGTRTVTTNVIPLSQTGQRQEEIARMLSGASITEEARAAARKLLEANAA